MPPTERSLPIWKAASHHDSIRRRLFRVRRVGGAAGDPASPLPPQWTPGAESHLTVVLDYAKEDGLLTGPTDG